MRKPATKRAKRKVARRRPATLRDLSKSIDALTYAVTSLKLGTTLEGRFAIEMAELRATIGNLTAAVYDSMPTGYALNDVGNGVRRVAEELYLARAARVPFYSRWWNRFQLWRFRRRQAKIVADGNPSATELAKKLHGDSEPSAWKG